LQLALRAPAVRTRLPCSVKLHRIRNTFVVKVLPCYTTPRYPCFVRAAYLRRVARLVSAWWPASTCGSFTGTGTAKPEALAPCTHSCYCVLLLLHTSLLLLLLLCSAHIILSALLAQRLSLGFLVQGSLLLPMYACAEHLRRAAGRCKRGQSLPDRGTGFCALYSCRNTARLSTNNCTLVVASQREVEFLQYWGKHCLADAADVT
jgi:hypothetical protein